MNLTRSILGATALFALTSAASASLLVYEGFNYTGGASGSSTNYVVGNTATGTGLTGSWASTDSWVRAITGSLSAPAGSGAFAAANNSAELSGGTTPSANVSLSSAIGTVNTTLYFSFVGQVGTNPQGGGELGLRFTDSGNTTVVEFGRTSSGTWGMHTGSAYQSAAGTSAGTLGFALYKVTFGAAGGANDRVDFFLNPGEAGEGAATASWTGLTLNDNNIGKMYLRARGDVNTKLDEVRVGTTWSDVAFVAIPEPSTYGLAGAGALAAVALVRRRRRA